jgi:transglutaminase-like putative cysteine protease
MIKKILLSSFIAFILCFYTVNVVKAEDNFQIGNTTMYSVQENGITNVSNNISIKNLKSEVYATNYVLNLKNINPSGIKVEEDGQPIDWELKEADEKKSIQVNFNTDIYGKDKTRNFTISYQDNNISVKTGEVWEITIPKSTDVNDFSNYKVVVEVPKELGTEAYSSPQPNNIEEVDDKSLYFFDKDKISGNGIILAFGEFQVFSFSLNYHLENPLNSETDTEIAIPPDTSTQKIYYADISPKPVSVDVDEDGNWMAKYKLNKRERLDVRVSGYAQIFATPRKFLSPLPASILANTKPTQYWQSDNPQIIKLAKQLKTVDNIYDYVVQTLSYDYKRVTPNIQRMGAVDALNNPNSAICMEFTDLFIAISRAAGIPAREVNGYAYTENPDIQPLSLVADVLHSWAEYWDSDRRVWVPVDPTWGSTTEGVDYFTTFDLRHIAFVIHGQDPVKPYPPGSYKLGSNPQKDVFVNFSQLPTQKYPNIEVEIQNAKNYNIFSSRYNIRIRNTGRASAYGIVPKIYVDGTAVNEKYIDILPPYGETYIDEQIDYGILGNHSPITSEVLVGGVATKLPINRTVSILYQLTTVASLFTIIIFFFHPKRPSFAKISDKIGTKIHTVSTIKLKQIYEKLKNKAKKVLKREYQKDT